MKLKAFKSTCNKATHCHNNDYTSILRNQVNKKRLENEERDDPCSKVAPYGPFSVSNISSYHDRKS